MSRSATEKDIDIMTKTVWGEARGEPDAGKVAVAHVIMNRANSGNRYGQGIAGVCLKDRQFSCWDEGDVNRGQIDRLNTNSQEYQKIRRIVEEVLDGTRPDNTYGSTHYHRTDTPHNWANGKRPAAKHGAHSFYNDID
ncbi:unnamed protein product [Adineta ricciae]|uniref:Cell wall hydrolase SleB domain-containing protein n=1 Tax=Adineta ricciae TaxID=249248 RepID=A0A816CNJ4_ADIRI|nr:unnamed protein product [Adineta ricciae]